jgi:uncharacterized membrane protein
MVLLVLLLTLILPLLLGLILGVSPYMVFALIISTLALQAAAALVGLGFRLHPATILLLMTSVAIGCMYGIYELCDLFAEYSPRIMKWLQKIDERTLKVPYFRKYGLIMLIPIIWIPGISLYGSPLVGWVFHWNRWLSLLCMVIGWMVATVVVITTSLGLIHLVF